MNSGVFMGIGFKDEGLSRRKDKKDGEESIPFKDMALSKRKDRETELEIEIRQCSSMILNLENLEKPFWINPNDNTKRNIGMLNLKSEKDVLCRFTEKPCVLYTLGDVSSGSSPYINYSHLDWCPSSEDSIRKYKLKGRKKGSLFYTSKIERIEEEK